MLRLLKKTQVTLKRINDFNNKNQHISTRYLKAILQFDGSMTKFVINMSKQQNVKPVINLFQQKEINLQTLQLISSKQSLVDLSSKFKMQKQETIAMRTISFSLKSQQKDSNMLLYFARSFWDKKRYDEIIGMNNNIPIGLSLIDQEIQIFKKLDWTGTCSIEVQQSKYKQQEIRRYDDIWSRGYSMINQGKTLCYLEELFLPSTFDLMK